MGCGGSVELKEKDTVHAREEKTSAHSLAEDRYRVLDSTVGVEDEDLNEPQGLSTLESASTSFIGIDGEEINTKCEDDAIEAVSCTSGTSTISLHKHKLLQILIGGEIEKETFGEDLLRSPSSSSDSSGASFPPTAKHKKKRHVKKFPPPPAAQFVSSNSTGCMSPLSRSSSCNSHTLTRISSKNLPSSIAPGSPSSSIRQPSTIGSALGSNSAFGSVRLSTKSFHRVVHAASFISKFPSLHPDRLSFMWALCGRSSSAKAPSHLPIDVKKLMLSFLAVQHFTACNSTIAVTRGEVATVQRWSHEDAAEDAWQEPLLRISPGVQRGRMVTVGLQVQHPCSSFNAFGAFCDDKIPLMGSNNVSIHTAYGECSDTGELTWWSEGRKRPVPSVTIVVGTIFYISINNITFPPAVHITVVDPDNVIIAQHEDTLSGAERHSVVSAGAYLFNEGETVAMVRVPAERMQVP